MCMRVCVWLSFAGPKANVLMKVFADQTVWSLFLNAGYTTVVLCVPSPRRPVSHQSHVACQREPHARLWALDEHEQHFSTCRVSRSERFCRLSGAPAARKEGLGECLYCPGCCGPTATPLQIRLVTSASEHGNLELTTVAPRWIVIGFCSGLQGYTPPMISQEIQLTWFKALSAGWRLWPFVHMLTFSGLIPMQYRLLFVDAVEVRVIANILIHRPLTALRFELMREGTSCRCFFGC